MEHFLLKLHIFFVLLCIYSVECSLGSLPERVISRNEEPDRKVTKWTCPFRDSDNRNGNEVEKWDTFLKKLFCKLSEYKIQASKRNYVFNNTVSLENCEQLLKNIQGKKIDQDNFEKKLKELTECSNLKEYDRSNDIKDIDVMIEELNDVLELTLRDRLHVKCKGKNVYIKGNYVTAGDIIEILNLQRGVTGAACKNLLSSDENKFVNIFALNTFFIDANITSFLTNSHKIVLMSVIAPNWENIGKNKIELKGEDAESPEKGIGMDGIPGKPGSPGGNFFGIGKKFVNGINLEISVNGGDGSDGLEGRKGENGLDGDNPTTPTDIDCLDRYCEDDLKINDFDCKKTQQCTVTIIPNYGGFLVPMPPTNITTCQYEMLGKTGMKGRNGGEGGKGGKGGYPGDIELIELKRHSQIHQFKNTGQNGVDGKGGAGGFGGVKGDDINVECKYISGRDSWSLVNTRKATERADSGQNGLDGGNTEGMENPKSAVVIHNLDKARIINDYKSYLRENLHVQFTNHFLNTFSNHLETNIDVKNVYNTLGLIDELQNLEDQVHTLNTDINFVPFYQSFLDRTSEYAFAPKESRYPKVYKKVLCYLYTAALGTIYNLQNNLESNLIIDIYKYLSTVENDIGKITDLENSKYKAKLINKYKDDYKRDIDKKINEAQELISNEITPEIQNTGSELDKQIETLVNEVIFLQKETSIEHDELIKKKQELKNILALQEMFTIFKIFGSVVSFIGPVGEVVGDVIDKGTEIAESFVDEEDDPPKVFELPQSVSKLQSINNKTKNIINQTMTCIRNSLKEIMNHSDILGKVSPEILNISDKLDTLDKNMINFKEIRDLENELIKELQNQEAKSDHNNVEQLDLIKKLQKEFRICTLLSDSYTKYKDDGDKLDAINSAIEQNEEKMKNLKQYEQNVYSSITPMLQKIQSDLQDIIVKLGKKSKVSLDVTRWQVNTMLRNMIQLMHQVTKGFQVEGSLARCLEKLEEAMDALIKMYEHIQDYQKDQNLAKYIAEISSISATDIVIANEPILEKDLREAVQNLEITVRSNIVVQRYKIAMSAFKQFVFPLAHKYFEDLILPSHFILNTDKTDTSLSSLVSKAAGELKKIKSKLEEYKMTVTNNDGCHGEGDFWFSDSNDPFFVWKNTQHKDMISRLLSGNTVTIKADVRKSSDYKDAIKFQFIEFNFKSKNKTLQTDINKALKRFLIFADHLGNSDYRYDNKIYEMMTGSQEIWYSFEKNKYGIPKSYSSSYEKIKNGTEILSPYASWRIRLEPSKRQVSFEDLKMYNDSVYLVLEGHGYFLNKKSSNCGDLKVDDYYKAIGYVDSKKESYRDDSMHPSQDNTSKENAVFKRFFL